MCCWCISEEGSWMQIVGDREREAPDDNTDHDELESVPERLGGDTGWVHYVSTISNIIE